jgi:hypothetical protein
MLLKTLLFIVICFVCSGSVLGQRRVIPVCPKLTDDEQLVGWQIKLVVPKDATVNYGRDFDYSYWTINFGDDKDRYELRGFSGLQTYYGEPSRTDIKASRKFTRRYWVHKKLRGVDARGTFKNGKLWRQFGLFGEVVSYHKVSAESAAYFDRLIATACFVN